MGQISATGTLFRDDFNVNGTINAANWSFPTGDPSFLGNTQIRASLPVAQGGNALIQLDTYNPTGNPASPTYFGTAAFTNLSFGFAVSNSPGGIAFEARVQLSPNDANGSPVSPSGLIAGVFPFVALPGGTHDEIDFEWIPKRSADPANPNLIQTNAYANGPYDNGIFETEPVPNGGTLMQFHVYRIEWLPQQVRWLVDGQVIRTESTVVPTHAMQLWMNIWGPPSTWPDVPDYGNLPPVGDPSQNQTRLLLVDYVSVESLAAQLGTAAAEQLVGSALNDHLHGVGGHDALLADAGADTLHGGGGADTLSGGAGADRLAGGKGDDVLIGGADADRLIGGAGADLFRIDAVAESRAGAADVITDFSRAEGDRIELSSIDTDPVAAGDQGFVFIADAAFGATPGVAELRVTPRGTGALVEADLDGDGVADIEIQVRNTASLVEADFIL